MPPTSLKQKIGLVFFGVVLTVILLEIGMRMAGFALTTLQDYRNRRALTNKDSFRILCLGESTTYLGGKYSYPCQLENILNARISDRQFDVINLGRCGITTSAILDQLPGDLSTFQPDMVVAMLGINDSDLILPQDETERSRFLSGLLSLKSFRLFVNLWQNGHIRPNDSERLPVQAAIQAQKMQSKFSISSSKNLQKLSRRNKLHPDDPDTLLLLGREYLYHRHYRQAEKYFKKLITKQPNHPDALLHLGQILHAKQDYNEAQRYFLRILKKQPKHLDAWLGLANSYSRSGKSRLAEKIYRAVANDNPNHVWVWTHYAKHYRLKEKYDQEERVLLEGLSKNPRFATGYAILGILYYNQGRLAESIAMYKKSISLTKDGHDPNVHFRLAEAYWKNGDLKASEVTLRRILDKNPLNNKVLGMLAQLYRELELEALADDYETRSEAVRHLYSATATVENYREIKKLIKNRGIPLVCVQYPLRSVNSLKNLFVNTENMIFVENRENFQKALAKSCYDDYFTDHVGGDFGHCTPRGNRLLAENVADAVLNYLGETN